MSTPLFEAAKLGDVGLIRELINLHDANPLDGNSHDRGWTALHYAAHHGHDDAVALLIDTYRVPVEIRATKRWTPLYVAVRNGQMTTVKLLIDKYGADVKMRNENRANLVHAAASGGFVEPIPYLVRTHLLHPNEPDEMLFRPLTCAANNGHLHVVKYLISEFGISPHDCRGQVGSLPLHYACGYGNVDIVQYLTANAFLVKTLFDMKTYMARVMEEEEETIAAKRGSSPGVTTAPQKTQQKKAIEEVVDKRPCDPFRDLNDHGVAAASWATSANDHVLDNEETRLNCIRICKHLFDVEEQPRKTADAETVCGDANSCCDTPLGGDENGSIFENWGDTYLVNMLERGYADAGIVMINTYLHKLRCYEVARRLRKQQQQKGVSPEGETTTAAAAPSKTADRIRAEVAKDVSVSTAIMDPRGGLTALHLAARAGHVELIEQLLHYNHRPKFSYYGKTKEKKASTAVVDAAAEEGEPSPPHTPDEDSDAFCAVVDVNYGLGDDNHAATLLARYEAHVLRQSEADGTTTDSPDSSLDDADVDDSSDKNDDAAWSTDDDDDHADDDHAYEEGEDGVSGWTALHFAAASISNHVNYSSKILRTRTSQEAAADLKRTLARLARLISISGSGFLPENPQQNSPQQAQDPLSPTKLTLINNPANPSPLTTPGIGDRYTVKEGNLNLCAEVMRLLIEGGACPNQTDRTTGITPLHVFLEFFLKGDAAIRIGAGIVYDPRDVNGRQDASWRPGDFPARALTQLPPRNRADELVAEQLRTYHLNAAVALDVLLSSGAAFNTVEKTTPVEVVTPVVKAENNDGEVCFEKEGAAERDCAARRDGAAPHFAHSPDARVGAPKSIDYVDEDEDDTIGAPDEPLSTDSPHQQQPAAATRAVVTISPQLRFATLYKKGFAWMNSREPSPVLLTLLSHIDEEQLPWGEVSLNGLNKYYYE